MSIFDKIVDNLEDIVFAGCVIALLLYLLPIPFSKINESNNQRDIRIAELNSERSINISWIGLKEVQSLKSDKIILVEDYDKGVYILVAVDGDNITQYYVNSADVSAVKNYLDQRD